MKHLILAGTMVVAWTASVLAGPVTLFSPEPGMRFAASDAGGAQPSAVNAAALQPGVLSAGDRVVVEPTPGLVLTVVVARVSTDINGTLSLQGTVEGYSDATLLLSFSGGQVLGTVEMPGGGHKYVIRYDASLRQHTSREVMAGEGDELEDAPSPIPRAAVSASAEPARALEDVPAAQATIDVMIVYTTNALVWAGGTSGINNAMAQAILRGQQAMDNSGAQVTLRLVHSA
ncbi:MAG: hypothetical protein V2A34_00965, partial [Lentisphaerota bacterium]